MKFEDYKLDFVYRDAGYIEWKCVCKSQWWVIFVNKERTEYFDAYPSCELNALLEEVGLKFTEEKTKITITDKNRYDFLLNLLGCFDPNEYADITIDELNKFFNEIFVTLNMLVGSPEIEEVFKSYVLGIRKGRNLMRISYTEGELLTKDDIGLVFKSRDGQEWKILAILEESFNPVVVVNSNNIDMKKLCTDGQDGFRQPLYATKDFDLISFVGPNFTENKTLRKFEFEGYLIELFNCTNIDNSSCYAIEQNLKSKYIGPLLKESDFVKKSLSKDYNHERNKLSKWKFTMEELPNEN